MANLSNINGKFVVEQTTGYVGVGTTDPNFLIEAAGANSEIALNSTSASIYRLRSTSSDSFIITKNGVGDRLVIAGNGDATFSGNVGVGGSPSDRLTVSGSGNFGIKIDNSGNTSSDYSAIRFVQNTAEKGVIYTNQEDLYLRSNSGDVLLQHSGGNVGIGVTSPNAKLSLAGGSNINSQNSILYIDTNSYYASGADRYITSSTAARYFQLNGEHIWSNAVSGTAGNAISFTERMRITSAGELQVTGNGVIKNEHSSANYSYWQQTGSDARLFTQYAQPLYFGTNASTKMTILSSGNVGIGTPTPSEILHIKGGGSGPEIRLEGTWGSHYIRAYNDNWNFLVGGTVNAINIKNNGNVGFGTTGPAGKVQIVNNSQSTAALTVCNEFNGGDGFVFQKWQYVESTSNFRLDLKQRVTSGVVQYAFDMVNNGTSYTSVLVLDRGNVGIGTTSPSYKLDVQGTGGPRIRVKETTDNTLNALVEVENSDGNGAMLGVGGSNRSDILDNKGFINAQTGLDGLAIGTEGTDSIVFYTQGIATTDQKMLLTSDGELKIGATSGAAARLHIETTAKDRKQIIQGNATSQGIAQKVTIVNQYPVVSSGSQLIIPFTSQGNLNSNTIIKIWGHSARFNASAPLGFEATIQVGHLNQLYSVTAISSSGNISGVSTSGMNVIISFTSNYSYAVSDGIFATIEYMTNNLSYSLQPANIVMN